MESLPVEIQSFILLRVSTIQDLHSLIQASAQYYLVFRLFKERILSTILHRVIYPAALPSALSTIKVVRLDVQYLNKKQVSHALKCFEEDQDMESTSQKLLLSTSLPLCRLHRSIGYFVHDCSKQWLSALQACSRTIGPSLDAEQKALSMTEEARLQRALYRFEFYCQIYRPSLQFDSNHEPLYSAVDQSHDFLSRFPPWQIEELTCIRDYVYQKLRDIFDRLEDDFVKSVIAEDFENVSPTCRWDGFFEKSPESDADHNEYEFDWYGNPDRFSDGDNFFANSHKSHQRDFMECIMSLGLPYLHRLFEADSQEQSKLIVSKMYMGVEFLTQALKAPPKITDLYLRSGNELGLEGDNTEGRSEAWLWSCDFKPRRYARFGDNKYFREWGYVFWDNPRLRDSGILSQRKARDLYRYETIRDWWDEPSAEERVKRVKPLLSSDPYKLGRKWTKMEWPRQETAVPQN